MSFRLSYRADPGNPWFSWQYVRDNSDTILAALREHASLTGRAVLIAVLIALPLAVLAYWFRPLAGPILALTGVLYTIPSLALFAFIAPYLGTGADHGAGRAGALRAAADRAQRAGRAQPGAPGGRARPPRAWATAGAAGCSGSTCRWRCPAS